MKYLEDRVQGVAKQVQPKAEKTDISSWVFDAFKKSKALDIPYREYVDTNGNYLVLMNGEVVAHQNVDVIMEPFGNIEDSKREAVGTIIDYNEHQVLQNHARKVENATYISISKGKHAPIQLVNIVSDASLVHSIFIHADRFSEAVIIESNIALTSQDALSNSIVCEIDAKEGSHIQYVAVDELGFGSTSYIKRVARTSKDATVNISQGMMNEGRTVLEVYSNLSEEGSASLQKTITVASANTDQNITTDVINRAPHTKGEIFNYGVVAKDGSNVFNGIGKIDIDGVHSLAEQETRVLLLDGAKRGDANPILLIEENEVSAGHAASVGRVSEEQLYYLMSRGIPREESEKLIILGFLEPVVEEIEIESIQQLLRQAIARKLNYDLSVEHAE